MEKKHSALALVVVLLLAASFPLIRSCLARPEGEITWYDDFATKDPRWDWAYHAGTGYRTLEAPSNGPSLVEIGITAASTSSAYSDCSLHETSSSHSTGVVEMRLYTGDDNGLTTMSGGGTRGWGFFDGDTSLGNAAWFWSGSPENDPALTGFKAQVIRNGQVVFNQDLYTGTQKIDMTQWHTYRVELSETGTSFYVDGNRVASTASRPANLQRVELWIDNLAVQLSQAGTGYTPHYLAVPQDEKMWIDWVSYHDLLTSPRSGRFFLNLPILFK